MKTIFKNISILIVILIFMTSCVASVGVRPRHHKHVNVVKKVHHPRVAVYKNVKYYRNGGIWYIKKNRKYVTVAAPSGVRINALPRGYRKVIVRGATYYQYKGVYYKRSGRKYVVVKV